MTETGNRILLVEDEEKIARLVELELRHEGYAVEKAFDGETGLERACTGLYDLLLLDRMLPGLDGLEVLRRIRQNPGTAALPVLLVTARDGIPDKVRGLDMGANDYLTKPFAMEELLARIRVLLRGRKPEPEEYARLLEACGVTLDRLSLEVCYRGKPVELTRREFILLQTLLEHKNIVMSREQLLQEGWGYEYYGETNLIDVYVRYLRHKISPDLITTVRGSGYMIKEEITSSGAGRGGAE